MWWKRGEGDIFSKGPPFPLALPHPRRKLLLRSVWHVPAAGRKACHLPRPGKERVRQAEKERRRCGRCPAGNRARMTVPGTGGGPSKKNGRLGEEGFCLPCSDTQKQPLGKQAEGGAGRIRYDAGSYGQRQEAATRQTPRTGCCPIHRKKQPAKKPGDRHQGAGPRAGQAVRDLMKRFWKGEGDRPKAAAGRARYDTAAMAKDRRGQRDRRCLLLFYQ